MILRCIFALKGTLFRQLMFGFHGWMLILKLRVQHQTWTEVTFQSKSLKQPQAYFNRTRFYSIVLLACCNSKMEFSYAWIGNPGSTHDATVSPDLYQNSHKRPNGYCILGDSAFPIMEWLITPFRDCGNLNEQQKRFNHTHSQCRQVIERAFGMLRCRFRRLLRFEWRRMFMLVDSVLSARVLHNLCLPVRGILDVSDDNGRYFGQDDGFTEMETKFVEQMMHQL